ncbi:MAG: acetate--CoA ligase family protein [Patescibacteria group bacterium]
MKNLFDLNNIAIIGSSSNKEKLGYQITKNLIDGEFDGKIYPVNLKEKIILGLKTYETVLDIDAMVDMAVIVIPREAVLSVVKQCVHKEIPYILIITAGFAEKDKIGKDLQEKLIATIHGTKSKIIGPNCLGLMNTAKNINLNFASTRAKNGKISLILQSGSIGAAIFDWAKENDIGIDKFISLGNKISVNEIDVLRELQDDPTTKVIAFYLEDITDPSKLLRLLKTVAKVKPVVILKGGMTKEGAKAASSHTAALTTDESLNLALFKQANIIYADDLEEFLNILEVFSTKEIDPSSGSLAIVANAGGPAILATDAASQNEFLLKSVNPYEEENIKTLLPNIASFRNPFDLGGDAKAADYEKLIKYLIELKTYSLIMVIVTPQSATEIEKTAEILGKIKNDEKIVVASFLGGEKIKKALPILKKMHVPSLEDPSLGVKLLAKIYNYFESRKKQIEYLDFSPILNTKKTEQELIKKYNIPYVKSFDIATKKDLLNYKKRLTYPVVYKSALSVHRGKENQIALNIQDFTELEEKVSVIGCPGILQNMIESPYEMIMGAKRDPKFGIIIGFGHGGIFTEEEKDMNFKIMPLTVTDINDMIEETRIWSVIESLRVKPLLVALSKNILKLMIENPDITSFELNPVKAFLGKIIAVDINIKRVKNE